jgi:hypothetical protein
MKLLLTVALLFTASAGIAFAEGRYETTTTNNDKQNGVFITDTKTGAVRYCESWGGKLSCSSWLEADD